MTLKHYAKKRGYELFKLLWIILLIPATLVEILCWWTNPIACLFVRKEARHDTVKRLDRAYVTMDREYLWGVFNLWSTHDNAADEGWWGLYSIPFLANTTQEDYNNSWLIRYWCRLWWLSRNTGYGWHYLLFSLPKDKGFQIKKDIPLWFGYYNSMNIGWKAHKLMARKLYANRLLGLRKYK